MRAAIYARYSSDAQSEQSIDDQVRICRARAEREGWMVVEVYADYAISGATAGRPRFQQLLADLRTGRFEVLIAEALDRISRDQEHIAGFHKRATFAGIRVVTIAEGDISELHIGLKGTMAALFLKDLAQKVHRGLEGRVRAGRSGGGLSYGYRIKRGLRPDGTPITGELEIVPAEAAIVRRVLVSYAAGRSPRAIAKELNAEHVSGPRGGRWTASLLLGNADREIGVLRNRLYIGERIWNRQRFIKDPNTGKRVARPNPRDAWIVIPVPELAIVETKLWQTVQARLQAAKHTITSRDQNANANGTGGAPNMGARLVLMHRPRWLLAGLVRCGCCNGPMRVVSNNGRLGCANRVERGTCDNPRGIIRDALLGRVLAGLKERLLTPELVEEFVRSYDEEIDVANRDRTARQASLASEQAKASRQIRNLLELIKEGHGSPTMVEELRALELRRDALANEIVGAATPTPVLALHSNLPALYRRKVEALEVALRVPEMASVAAEALRGLVDAILIFPGVRRGEVTVQVRGDLAAFVHLADLQASPPYDANTKQAVLGMKTGRSRTGARALAG